MSLLAPQEAPPRAAPVFVAATLAVAYLTIAAWLILSGAAVGPTASDQAQFHLPTIRQFAAQWPAIDFRHYPSATTPGYHLALAAVARAVGDPAVGERTLVLLRLLTALPTAGLLGTLGWAVTRRLRDSGRSLALCLPFAASQYVFPSGVWLVPHNPAWWCVLGILLLSLSPKVDRRTFLIGGTLLAVVAFVRQIHVWSAGPLWIAAWLGTSREIGNLDGGTRRSRLRRTIAVAAVTVPAMLILGYFHHLWGGLTQPGEPWARPGLSAAAPAVILCLIGVYGPFLLASVPAASLRTLRRPSGAKVILAGVMVGLLAGSLPHSSFDMAAGRWSGLWNVVRHVPTILDRSPLIIVLSAMGGGVFAAFLLVLPSDRTRVVALTSLASFTAAHCTVGQAWQRYYEPFVLMLLTLLVGAARPGGGENNPPLRWDWLGPLALGTGLAGLTFASLR